MTNFDKFILDALYPALKMLVAWIERNYKQKTAETFRQPVSSCETMRH